MIANLASKPAAAPNFRTGDERLVKLTSSAANKVSTLLTKQGRPSGVLRVAVVGVPGDTGTEAILISAGGTAIAGYSVREGTQTERLFVWSDITGATAEVVIPGDATRLVPRYLSADGLVLVGEAITGTRISPDVLNVTSRRAFRWTRQGGVFIMPGEARSQTRVDGFSDDGAIVLAADLDSIDGMDFRPTPFVATTALSLPLPLVPPPDWISSAVMDPTGKMVAGIGTGLGGQTVLVFWRVAGVAPPNPSISRLPPVPYPLPSSQSALVAFTAGGRTLLGKSKGPDGKPMAWLMTPPFGPPPI